MSSIRTVLGVPRRISSVCAVTHDQLFFRGVMLPGERCAKWRWVEPVVGGDPCDAGYLRWRAMVRAQSMDSAWVVSTSRSYFTPWWTTSA
jgi:hypothetical protein